MNKTSSKLTNFLHHLQLDVKGLAWFSCILMVFRILFLGIFWYQLQDVSLSEVGKALWLGFRISLKTAGFIVALSFFLCTLPGIWRLSGWTYYSLWKIRKTIYGVFTILLSFLFCLRIPYYEIFHATFNAMIINGGHDDIGAILNTAIHTYGLVWRLPLAAGFCFVMYYVMHRLYTNHTKEISITSPKKQKLVVFALVVAIPLVSICLRFGGAFTYNKSIHWENAARTTSNLLNEAILDDAQALKRVESIYNRSKKQREITITASELRQFIESVGGNGAANTIDEAFRKTIKEEKLLVQPKNVVFVLGESYGLWPFLQNYADLGDYIVQEGKAIQQMPNSMETQYMLAHGTGTMPAINGFLTGLADTGLYANYESVSYHSTYGTGIGQIMKHFGYKTVFWYGGFGTWQDVERFSLAQGFDEFHGATSFPYTGGNAWGAPDGDLFHAIEEYIAKEGADEKVFHFIMTSSNHPPYSVNLEEAGFDASQVRGKGDESIKKDDTTVNEIGHFWYADHTMGEMIRTVERHDKSALFFITGDHSERFNFAKEVDIPTYSAIPFIVYGQGVQKEWLQPHAFGAALQINPTIAQLVGRLGDTYESITPSLFDAPPMGFNHRLYVDERGIHEQGKGMPSAYEQYIQALRTISAWRVVKGNVIE